MITAAWQSYARSRAQAMDPGPGTNEWIRRGNRIDRKEPFGRVLSGLAAILTVLVSLCGCKDSSDTEQSNDAPFAREQINVFVPAGFELQERWRPIADEWSIRTEAAASVREYESGGRGPRADDAVVPTDAHLLVLPITQMANLAAFEIIQSLPDEALSESELNWYDIINGLRNAACSWRGQPTIVPISSPVFVCCYRRDLLESARLHPPETWQDYQKLLDTIDTWAPGLSVVEPWSVDWRASMFIARSLAYAASPGSYSLFFDIQTGEPLIHSPGFERGLSEARTAREKMSPNVLNYSPVECLHEFLEGRAALGVTLPIVAAADGNGPALRNRAAGVRLGFCSLPGSKEVYSRERQEWRVLKDNALNRPTLTAFTGLCAALTVQCNPRQAHASANLLASMLRDGPAAGLPPRARSLCRESQSVLVRDWTAEILTSEEAGQFAHAVAESLRKSNTVAELAVPNRARFRRVMSDYLGDALNGEQDADECLDRIRTAWQQLIREFGIEEFRNHYRSGLGLSPMK